MTGSVYDQDTDSWQDEDGDFAAAVTNTLILTASAGFLILLAWHAIKVLVWVL